jgi:hypothetical protein
VHEGDVKLRRGRLHWLVVVAVVVLPVVLAAVGAALMLVTQQRTYRAWATVVPPHISTVGGGMVGEYPPDRAAESLARSPQVVEAVVERASDGSITAAWLRRHSSVSSRRGSVWSEEVTLTVTDSRRAQVVRVANIYAAVFANAWRPQVEAPLRRAILAGHIRFGRSCGVRDGKQCLRWVSQRKILAGVLGPGMFVGRPKDASLVPLQRLPAVIGGLVGAMLGLAISALLMHRYRSLRPSIAWWTSPSPAIRADGIPGLSGKSR